LNILVFNCGSSSLGYKVFEAEKGTCQVLVSGKAHRVGVKGKEPSFIEHRYGQRHTRQETPIATHRQAAGLVFDYLAGEKVHLDAVGHRFVHGGHLFQKSALVTPENFKKLKACLPLAPLHNPTSLSMIEETGRLHPGLGQYVTFDSAFHTTLPEQAYTYAVPETLRKKFSYRKYGFHGLSYTYVTLKAAEFLRRPLKGLKLVACHLGTGGSSVAAIKDGYSVDTSMGFSPLQGLMMSTRCGDIDPMLSLYLMSVFGYRPDALLDKLNRESGLLGVSGISSDLRDIIQSFHGPEGEDAKLSFSMYVQRLKKYVGAYATILQGMDALIFTDDIGVGNHLVREKLCQEMDWCGLFLDEELNRQAKSDAIYRLEKPGSKVAILTIPTDEEYVICREGEKLLSRRQI